VNISFFSSSSWFLLPVLVEVVGVAVDVVVVVVVVDPLCLKTNVVVVALKVTEFNGSSGMRSRNAVKNIWLSAVHDTAQLW
jgi:hypothetical protein